MEEKVNIFLQEEKEEYFFVTLEVKLIFHHLAKHDGKSMCDSLPFSGPSDTKYSSYNTLCKEVFLIKKLIR